jgi:sigma-B regulation protein RsbU (phosphoserine phosphatase)
VLSDITYETHDYPLPPDADVLIYSDGAFELALPGGRHWALEDFIELCARTARSPHWTLDDLVGQLRDQSQAGRFDDDCTLVRITVR